MVSMTVQMAYAFYPAVLIFDNAGLTALPVTWVTVLAVAIFGLLFLISLRFKNRDIKLGPVVIPGKPW